MAARLTNIARGGGPGGKFKASVTGLKELEKKLKRLQGDNPELQSDIQQVVEEAAEEERDEMKNAARAAGWQSRKIKSQGKTITGNDAIDSIFAFGQFRGSNRRRISALAGVSKQKTLVVWTAGRRPRSPRAKVPPGGKVAESLAMMLEIGTSRIPAHPAIRATIIGTKAVVIDKLTTAWNGLLQKYSA